jgi:phenylpyruvate tautomerase PptA (4-oxalocrotonate tautomerase family)
MQRQKGGHFINVSSVAGHKVGPGFAVYAATKHAVRALSEGLRQEVKAYNIRTTVISPGAVATELPNSVSDPETATRIGAYYDDAAIPADSFARTVAFAISQPADVDINEIPSDPAGTLREALDAARHRQTLAGQIGKQALADGVTKTVMTSLGYGADAVSVSLEEVAPGDWTEKVYQPDIMNGPGKLYKKPGYVPR